MKKMLSLMAAAMLMTGSFAVSTPVNAAANPHASNQGKMMSNKDMPKSHAHGCANVMVSGKMAVLKMNPSMGARTLRTAKHGETFAIVMDGGRPHLWDGWWLVRAANGYRYWVHKSVISCK